MENLMWVMVALAGICILVGIVSTIIIKIDAVPKWRTICKVLFWIIGLLIFKLVVWWIIDIYQAEQAKNRQVAIARTQLSSGIAVVQPKEEWVFSQENLNGERVSFEVEITKREAGQLNGVIQQYNQGKRVNVAGLRLNEVGDKLVGTWVNYIDGDNGEVNLIKLAANIWSGKYELQDKTTRLCDLKRK